MNKKTQEIPTPELLSEMESLQIYGGLQNDTMGFNLYCPKSKCEQANCTPNCGTKCTCISKTSVSCKDDDIQPQPNTIGQCL